MTSTRLPGARSYLTFKGPGDLYIEMCLCEVVPRKGEIVRVSSKVFRVTSVTWDISTGEDQSKSMWPTDMFPQQGAVVTLKPVSKRKRK